MFRTLTCYVNFYAKSVHAILFEDVLRSSTPPSNAKHDLFQDILDVTGLLSGKGQKGH